MFLFDLFVLLLIYKVFIRRVINSIEILSKQSEKVSQGDYGVRTNFANDDEFGRLSKVLNNSSDHIEYLLNDLEKRQQRLDRANEIFEGLASNTVAGIYILDESLKFIYANQQIANILRCEKSVLENDFLSSACFHQLISKK